MEFGISDRWQVEAEWTSFMVVKPESGPSSSAVGDLELSTQYSFMAIGGFELTLVVEGAEAFIMEKKIPILAIIG